MSNIENGLPARPDDGNYEILVGEEGQRVSVQLIQQIFNEVTGKAECLTESFKRFYQIDFEHIRDLNTRINQTLEQFQVVSQNFTVVLYYVDNSKDELRSFERFAFNNAGASSPVESIFIKYNFLIVPSKLKKTQSYTISIRIASSVALRKKLEDDNILDEPPFILRLMRNRGAYSKVDYVDYSVARTMQAVIKEWFSILPYDDSQKILLYIQRRSHLIPRVLRYLGVIFAAIICMKEVYNHVGGAPVSPAYNLQVEIACFIILCTAFIVSGWLGAYSESKIDEWSPLSYLKFNKADELEIARYKKKNRNSILKSLFGFFAALLTSILTKILASIIINYLYHAHQ